MALFLAADIFVQEIHLRYVVERLDELDGLLFDGFEHFLGEMFRVQRVLDPEHGVGDSPETREVGTVVDVGKRGHRQDQRIGQVTTIA